MRPAVDALSASFRVLTFSLDMDVQLKPDATGKQPEAIGKPDATEDARGLDRYADDIAALMTQAGVERAVMCGVSFGGLIAVRFAARYPDRCEALILASTPRSRL